MTACIVGWAHTPFGRLEGETVESLIVRVATDALADAGIAPADVDEIVLGHFNAGFSAQDFTASLVLQASPDLRFKRATRVENACATGSAAVHQGLKAIAARQRADRAGGRRRADDDDARGRDRQEPAQGLLCARGGRHRRRLCRHLRQDRRALFPEIRRPVRRARADRRQEPQERRRQSVMRRCARISASSSAAARARRIRSSPVRSSAPTARWSPTAPPRSCSPTSRPRAGSARRWRSARPRMCRISCRCRSATSSSSKAARWRGSARSARPASRSPIFRSSRPTTASPSPS